MIIATRPQDVENERAVAAILEDKWSVKFHRYGFMDSVDWWLERSGSVVAYAELKCRDVEFGHYPTTYLALRKWLALQLASLTGPPALFIVRHTDAIASVNVRNIDARQVTIAGRSDRAGYPNDQEPIIEVPLEVFRVIA